MITQEVTSSERGAAALAPQRTLHILVLASSYAPERTGSSLLNTELCEYLASRGHKISIVTCFPHYPEWKVPPAYRRMLWNHETRNEVEIFRSYAYIPPRRTTLRRILYDSSIAFSAALRGLPIREVDLVLAISPPLQAGVAGNLLARLKGVPFLLHVHDLVPDLAIAVGMLRNSWAIKLARILEKQVYKNTNGILVISDQFAANLSDKGVPESKIFFLPLWVDTTLISPRDRNGPFRKAYQIDEAQTVVIYTGNMGAKQKLENVLEAASRLQEERDILFLFVGDGSEKERLQQYAEEKRLANVRFLPLVPPQPRELLPEMLAAADMLILNQSAQVLDAVIPSKLFTYMAAGRPIVAAVNPASQAAHCIRRATSGVAVDAENPAALAEAIRHLHTNRELARHFGQQGRLFVEQHHERDRILSSYEDVFVGFANNGTR